MIITLDEAKKIDPTVTLEDLKAYETMVRGLTNNTFQNIDIRFALKNFVNQKTIELTTEPFGLREGDTIEISQSVVNNGLAVISEINGSQITVADTTEIFFKGSFRGAFITKIQYPADIVFGVKGLIEFKAKMGDKLGIKSESIARMSVTYYDINANDNVEGFPAAKFSFLSKYEKMRWD